MADASVNGSGTREDPWRLKTPSGSSEYQMYRDETAAPPALVCVVGKTVLSYRLQASRRRLARLRNSGFAVRVEWARSAGRDRGNKVVGAFGG